MPEYKEKRKSRYLPTTHIENRDATGNLGSDTACERNGAAIPEAATWDTARADLTDNSLEEPNETDVRPDSNGKNEPDVFTDSNGEVEAVLGDNKTGESA